MSNEEEEDYFEALEEAVPDIWTINKDPEFLNWLQGIDPLNNRPRQDLINEAQDRLDANRVAQFFKAWQRGGAGKPKEEAITPAQLNKATQDRVHGRITEEAYTKICDNFQKQQTRRGP